MKFENDVAEGTKRENECLANDPSSDMRDLITSVVDPVISPTTTSIVTNPTTPAGPITSG